MAAGDDKDINEMFQKMGEKLGWFQHKDLETALKSLSKSTRKKRTKTRIEAPDLQQKQRKKKENLTEGSKIRQNACEDEKDVKYSVKRVQAHTNLPRALGLPDVCDNGKNKHSKSESGHEGKTSTHKAVLNHADFSSSDEENGHKVNCASNMIKTKPVLPEITYETEGNKISEDAAKCKTVIDSHSYRVNDSVSEKGDVDDTYVSCVSESCITQETILKDKESTDLNKLKFVGKSGANEKQGLPFVDQTIAFSVNDTIIQKPVRVSAESFSPEIDDTFGYPQGESTRIHRRSSVSYKNLVGSSEDLDCSGPLDDKHYQTCRAELSSNDLFNVHNESENPIGETLVKTKGNNNFSNKRSGSNQGTCNKTEARRDTEQKEVICIDMNKLSLKTKTPANKADHPHVKETVNEVSSQGNAQVDNDGPCIVTSESSNNDSYEVVDVCVQTDISLTENSLSLKCGGNNLEHEFNENLKRLSRDGSTKSGYNNSENESELQSDVSEIEVRDVSVQTDMSISDDGLEKSCLTENSSELSFDSKDDAACNKNLNIKNNVSSCDHQNVKFVTSENMECDFTDGTSVVNENSSHCFTEEIDTEFSCEENASLVSDNYSSDGSDSDTGSKIDNLNPSSESRNICSKEKTEQDLLSERHCQEAEIHNINNLTKISASGCHKPDPVYRNGTPEKTFSHLNAVSAPTEATHKTQSTWRQNKVSESSSDDDLDAYLEKLRNPKKSSSSESRQSISSEASPVSMEDFIVEDDEMSSESDDNAFYIRENRKLEETPLTERLKSSKTRNTLNFSDSDESDFSSNKYPNSVTKHKKRQTAKPKVRSNSWSLSDEDDIIMEDKPTKNKRKTGTSKKVVSECGKVQEPDNRESKKETNSKKIQNVKPNMLPDSDEELLFKTPKPLIKKTKNKSNKENESERFKTPKIIHGLDVREEKLTNGKRQLQKVEYITFSDSDDDQINTVDDKNNEELEDLGDFRQRVLKELPGNSKSKSKSLTDKDDLLKTPSSVLKGSLSKFYTPQPVKLRYSFLKSLSADIQDHLRDPEAARFVRGFKKKKEELSQHLFRLYNQSVFDSQLPSDLPIEWNKRLLRTAGYCTYKKSSKNFDDRSVKIELSTKVCDSAERVRDTLIHELCHAAVWLINGTRDGHGRYWRYWARKSNQVHPEIPIIARCHDYSINTKYTYQCTQCGYSIGRHSKSLDTEKKVCGYCHGQFELLQNSGSLSSSSDVPMTPKTPRTPNRFALYVKEHYSTVKKKDKNLKHGDVMKELSKQFAEMNKI